MSKMTVIQLLNKIANKEEVPAKIKFRNDIFRYTGCSYYCDAMCTTLFNIYNFSILNEKIEIIEEDKEIEKLDLDWVEVLDFKEQAQQDCVKMVFNKINEIIDKIDKINKLETK